LAWGTTADSQIFVTAKRHEKRAPGNGEEVKQVKWVWICEFGVLRLLAEVTMCVLYCMQYRWWMCGWMSIDHLCDGTRRVRKVNIHVHHL